MFLYIRLMKARKGAPIGTRKKFGERWYVKTDKGWRYDPRGEGRKGEQAPTLEDFKKQRDAERQQKVSSIVKMAQEGKSTKEIAEKHNLSHARIMQHISAARKSGVNIAKRKRAGKEKVNVYEAYNFTGSELGAAQRSSIRKDSKGWQDAAKQGYYEYENAAGGQAQRIQVARASITQHPTTNYIPKNLGGALRQHQADVVNLAMKRYVDDDKASMLCTSGPQPLYSKILTPSGWRTMGDLKKGDKVIAVDGTHATILETFDKGRQYTYSVFTSDEGRMFCTDEHLFSTSTLEELRKWRVGKGEKSSVKPLSVIRQNLYKFGQANQFIPIASLPKFNKVNLPLDPYLLGFLLGDGCISRPHGIRISTADQESLVELGRIIEPLDLVIKHEKNYDYRISTPFRTVGKKQENKILNKLRDLSLLGTNCDTKFIPPIYFLASSKDRLSLLQGLMDTDGYVSGRDYKGKGSSSLSFCTVNDALADGIIELVRSLSGVAKKHIYKSGHHSKSKGKGRGWIYVVSITLPSEVLPFRLSRKLAKYNPIKITRTSPHRSIIKVVPTGKLESVKCILIDHPSHLYITDDYIVTHNTGVGKTRSEIGLAATYLAHNKGKVLIVTENDRIMAGGMAGDAKAMNTKMMPVKKLQDLDQGDGIYVTTYRDLKIIQEKFGDIGLVVFDEAHNMKNTDMSSKAKLGVELMSKAKHNALFTATPIDKPAHLDYICQANRLNFKEVMRDLGYYRSSQGWGTNLDAEQTADRLDAFFSSMTKQGGMVKHEIPLQGLELGMTTVKLTATQQSKYDAAYEKMQNQLAVAEPREKGLLKAKWLMRIRSFLEEAKIDHTVKSIKDQLAEGRQAILFATSINDRAVTGDAKDFSISEDQFDNIKEMIKGSGGKISSKECVTLAGFYDVPVQSVEAINEGKEYDDVADLTDNLDPAEVKTKFSSGSLNEIQKRLKKEGIEYASVFNSNKEAVQQIKDFQAGKLKVVLTTPASGATGISLDDTTGKSPRTAIMMSSPFSACDFIQIAGRVHRLTTKSQSRVVLLSTDTEVETWNKGIIANKLTRLGASVKGDVETMSIEDLEKCENLPPEQAKKFMEAKKAKGLQMAAAAPSFKMNVDKYQLTKAQMDQMKQEKEAASAKRKAARAAKKPQQPMKKSFTWSYVLSLVRKL